MGDTRSRGSENGEACLGQTPGRGQLKQRTATERVGKGSAMTGRRNKGVASLYVLCFLVEGDTYLLFPFKLKQNVKF